MSDSSKTAKFYGKHSEAERMESFIDNAPEKFNITRGSRGATYWVAVSNLSVYNEPMEIWFEARLPGSITVHSAIATLNIQGLSHYY